MGHLEKLQIQLLFSGLEYCYFAPLKSIQNIAAKIITVLVRNLINFPFEFLCWFPPNLSSTCKAFPILPNFNLCSPPVCRMSPLDVGLSMLLQGLLPHILMQEEGIYRQSCSSVGQAVVNFHGNL